MTLALSILLLALGAVLVWGVDYEVAGIDLDVVGVILVVVGAVGAILALATSARAGPRRVVRRDYVE
ncbi:MAG TPA: DUF6458 family protein [Gaiellaceae bacterium]|nr:DUF6458 family protein [Gaiellaceae bacterium]